MILCGNTPPAMAGFTPPGYAKCGGASPALQGTLP